MFGNIKRKQSRNSPNERSIRILMCITVRIDYNTALTKKFQLVFPLGVNLEYKFGLLPLISFSRIFKIGLL